MCFSFSFHWPSNIGTFQGPPNIRIFQRPLSIGTFHWPPSTRTFQGSQNIGTFHWPPSTKTFQGPQSIGTFHWPPSSNLLSPPSFSFSLKGKFESFGVLFFNIIFDLNLGNTCSYNLSWEENND